MKRTTKLFMMMLALVLSAGITSCDDVTGAQDNPVVPTPTPTPTPAPTYASDLERPLTFKAAMDGVKVTFKFKSGAKPDYKKVEYSLDQGATWTALKRRSQSILLEKAGDMVMFRGDNATYNGDAQFVTELVNANARTRTLVNEASGGSIYAFLFGNVMSLIQNKNFEALKALAKGQKATFKTLFKGARIDAQNANGTKKLVLPAIGQEVVIDAFKGMFEGSTIQNAPEVVAEVLGYGTIADMFKDCEDLKNVFFQLGYVAEGTTPEQAMGGVLGGTTGKNTGGTSDPNAGGADPNENNGNSNGGGVNITWNPPSEPGNQDGHSNPLNPFVNPITLDDMINASGIAEDVLKKTTITTINAETGEESKELYILRNKKSINISDANNNGVSALSVTEGDEFVLIAHVSPHQGGNNSMVSWSLSSDVVQFVDQNDSYSGALTKVSFKAIKAGVVTITASHGELKASVEVTVNPKVPEIIAVTGVSLDQKTLSLETGGTATLTATVAPTDATDQTVTWSSDKESVATVDKDGKVTAVAAGEATITVTTSDGEFTAFCKVTVTKKEEDEPEPENPVIDATDDFEDGGDPLK